MILMINDEIDFFNTKSQLLYTPEGYLLAFILYHALDEYRRAHKKPVLQPMGRRALEFFATDSDLLKLIAWLLGVPVYKINAIAYDKELFSEFKRTLKRTLIDIENHLAGKKEENYEEDIDLDDNSI